MQFAFLENERQQIRKVVDYAQTYIYQTDDILDMMNNELPTPNEDSNHTVLVGVGQWICYYLIDHPIKGRCHYFHIKPDITGVLPDKSQIDYVVKEFGIEKHFLDEYIIIKEVEMVVDIIIPFND